LFEEADAFLGLEDDPDSLKINPFYYDSERDILLLEAILNSEPSPPLPNQDQNMPSFKEELKAYEAQTVKSSIDEPPEVELKDLPHHLEYAFLEGDDKLPIIIAKELRTVTFNLDQTSRYSANYNDMTTNRINVIDMACKEYSQEVLGFSDVIASGNPTPYYDPIVSTSSPTVTPFGDSDFLLEEVDAFLALEDDPTSP
nr:reverse transcriptase domain-containing protein [Tanacetum cinerariifolium]